MLLNQLVKPYFLCAMIRSSANIQKLQIIWNVTNKADEQPAWAVVKAQNLKQIQENKVIDTG